jgi:hypothetical protein
MYKSMSTFDRIKKRGSKLLSEYGASGAADKFWPGEYFAIVTGPETEQQ